MAGKRIAIPLARFEPNRALAREVFLPLPLNQRSVRLSHAGGELGPELLARLLARGHTHLDVGVSEESSPDPATYPLYLDELSEAEAEAALRASGAEGEASTRHEPGGSILEGEERLAVDGQTLEPRTSFESGGHAEAARHLAGEAAGPEALTRVKGSAEAEDETTHLTSVAEAEEEARARFAAAREAEKIQAEAAPREEAELSPEELRIRAIEEAARAFEQAAQAESETKLSGQTTEEEAPTILRAVPQDLDPSRSFAAEAAGAATTQLASNADEEDARRVAGASEKEVVFTVGAAEEDAPESAVFRLEQKLEAAKETLLAGGDFDLEKEKVHILRDARSSILVSKIADRILELSQQAELSPAEAAEAEELREALKLAEIGADVDEKILARFSVEPDLTTVEELVSSDRPVVDQVVDLSDHMGTYASSRDQVRELMQEEERTQHLNRSATHRDLPQTVSRLAAYLAVSIGYVNQDFLADLAVGAVCHFQEKEGKKLQRELAPAFTQAFLGNEEASSPADDSREILSFLDAYLEDPECDRLEKEFQKKVFDRTAERLRTENALTPWNLQCWEGFVERGPSLEIHSLCNRAAAQAIKYLRTNLDNS